MRKKKAIAIEDGKPFESKPARQHPDIIADFLTLKISSTNTRRNYSKAIADFCARSNDGKDPTTHIACFLALPQPEAVYQTLQYKQQLIEAKLAPNTINVRLCALKSLVNYAHQRQCCNFNLADVECLKVEIYRDTTGIPVEGFREMIQIPDRTTTKGIRDYAILRLLWDNALRRNEICSLNISDFHSSGRLAILGKGKLQKIQIDLSPASTTAIATWLSARGKYQPTDPLFSSLDRRSTGHRLDGSSIYRLVRQFSESAGIDKVVSPHRIRHSSITAYLDVSGGNIRAAQQLSRHADLNTLTRYDDNRHKYQAQATNTLADLV